MSESKLKQLLKKREQLNAQIQRVRATESAQKRKEETRRKVLLGALMMEMLEQGELDREQILERLERFLTRELDRRLFDLPVDSSDEDKNTAGEK